MAGGRAPGVEGAHRGRLPAGVQGGGGGGGVCDGERGGVHRVYGRAPDRVPPRAEADGQHLRPLRRPRRRLPADADGRRVRSGQLPQRDRVEAQRRQVGLQEVGAGSRHAAVLHEKRRLHVEPPIPAARPRIRQESVPLRRPRRTRPLPQAAPSRGRSEQGRVGRRLARLRSGRPRQALGDANEGHYASVHRRQRVDSRLASRLCLHA